MAYAQPETVAPPPPRSLPGALDAYACVICRDLARPPAMTCSNGCPYCRGCLVKSLRPEQQQQVAENPTFPIVGLCQTCRKESVFVQCPLIDRAVRDAPAACRNMCSTLGLTVSTVEAHEAICGDRFVQCRFSAAGCQWIGRCSAEGEHGTTCEYRLEERYRALAGDLARSYDRRVSELSTRLETIIAAVRGVVSARILGKLSVDLRMAAIADRPEFAVAGRTFSFRSEPLAADPAIPRLKQAYGCCIVGAPSERSASGPPRELWVHLLAFLLVDGAAVGVGSIIGTLSESVPSALPVNFVVPVTQPPPWRVSISVMAMKLLDSALTSLP